MLRFSAVLGVAAMACSGPSIALSDLDQELQQARCERFARCGLFPDEASCLRSARFVPDASLAAAVAAHKIDFDGQRAKQCVDAIARQSCDASAHDVRVPPAACTDMLAGRIAGGGGCSFDAECASGTCTLPDICPTTGCCTGTCRPAQAPAQPGAPCAKARDCVAGAVCGEDDLCHTPANAGESCNNDHDCGDGLGCINPLSTMPGTCRALPHQGEPCPYLRCADEGLRCDDAHSHQCVPVGLPGAPGPDGSECAEGLECELTTHMCREYPTLGMPCTSRCAADSFCSQSDPSAGTCVAPQADGATCSSDAECASLFCFEGPVFDACQAAPVCF
jgi:hypothetical protein